MLVDGAEYIASRMIIPEDEHDEIMMTADQRYWTDPVWRRKTNEFLQYFKKLRAEVEQFLIIE